MHDLASLLQLHERLDDLLLARGERAFVSDWNSEHPFVDRFLGLLARGPRNTAAGYVTLDEVDGLAAKVAAFHTLHDRRPVVTESVVAGQGATPLITTLCLWLRMKGVTQVFYLPPLYFAFVFMLRTLGINARPISGSAPWTEDPSINLPDTQTVLIVTDPIWFAGVPLSTRTIERLASWQQATRSLVIVDGSFQYLSWTGRHSEMSSRLDPNLTVRLVCPTKSLAVHGYRFAYLLCPTGSRNEMNRIYEHTNGSASIDNCAFASQAMDVLLAPSSNHCLGVLIARRYADLTQKGTLIAVAGVPSCGYFVFVKPKRISPGTIGMGAEYFDLRGYAGYVRVNLLNELAVRSLIE